MQVTFPGACGSALVKTYFNAYQTFSFAFTTSRLSSLYINEDIVSITALSDGSWVCATEYARWAICTGFTQHSLFYYTLKRVAPFGATFCPTTTIVVCTLGAFPFFIKWQASCSWKRRDRNSQMMVIFVGQRKNSPKSVPGFTVYAYVTCHKGTIELFANFFLFFFIFVSCSVLCPLTICALCS